MNLALAVHRAIQAAGISVVGVSIGDPADKGTWRVQPSELQAAAQPTIYAFDRTDPAHVIAEKDAEIDNLTAFRALAQATYELKTNAWTAQQFRDRIKEIYRSF